MAAGGDWRRIATMRDVVYLFGDAKPLPLEIFAGPRGRRLLTLTAYWRGEEFHTSPLSFKFAQKNDKLHGRNPPGGIIVIASDYAGEPDEALARIRKYTTELEQFSTWRARQNNGR